MTSPETSPETSPDAQDTRRVHQLHREHVLSLLPAWCMPKLEYNPLLYPDVQTFGLYAMLVAKGLPANTLRFSYLPTSALDAVLEHILPRFD